MAWDDPSSNWSRPEANPLAPAFEGIAVGLQLGKASLAAHEAKLNMQAQVQDIAYKGFQLQTAESALKTQQEDQQAIPEWLKDHQTWSSRQDAEWPTPKSEWGIKTINDIRLRDSANIKSTTVTEAIHDFSGRVDELRKVDPAAAGQFAQYIGQPSVNPQVLQRLTDAETKAQVVRRQDTLTKERPNAVKILDEVDRNRGLAQQAKDSGDDASYQMYTKRADDLENSVTKGTEEQTVGWDDQGRPIVTFVKGAKGGAAAGGPTVGSMSLQQQKEMKYQNAAQLINDLQKSLRPEDVGARGTLGEYVLDRGMAQLSPKFANKQRIANRDALTILRESLMREVTDDTRRFSAQDREDISNALPSSGAFESYTDAMTRMKKVQDIIIDRARNYAERAGQPIPMFAQTKDEIVSNYKRKKSAMDAAVAKGNLSRQEADAQSQKDYTSALDALTKFH